MRISGSIIVSDLLDAVGIACLPDSSDLSMSERLDFDDIDVDASVVREALEDEDDSSSELLRHRLNESEVLGLAAAIRRGDRAEAELLLDRLVATDGTVAEWVQRGRYSGKAKTKPSEMRQAA